MSELKPGDRALVVGLRVDTEWNGRVVTLTHRAPPGPRLTSLWTVVAAGWGWNVAEDSDVFNDRNLIRLPPDDEAKRLFRETEKPVAA